MYVLHAHRGQPRIASLARKQTRTKGARPGAPSGSVSPPTQFGLIPMPIPTRDEARGSRSCEAMRGGRDRRPYKHLTALRSSATIWRCGGGQRTQRPDMAPQRARVRRGRTFSQRCCASRGQLPPRASCRAIGRVPRVVHVGLLLPDGRRACERCAGFLEFVLWSLHGRGEYGSVADLGGVRCGDGSRWEGERAVG